MINKIEQALSTLNASFKEDSLSRASENDEATLSLEDYITELDRSMESIVPNAQQKLDDIISKQTVSDHPITNAFGTVAFSASMRMLIVEQLLSMKKIGNTKVDYGQLTKNALKIVVPLVVLKMIHSKYKQSHTKTANFEHSIEALYKLYD